MAYSHSIKIYSCRFGLTHFFICIFLKHYQTDVEFSPYLRGCQYLNKGTIIFLSVNILKTELKDYNMALPGH